MQYIWRIVRVGRCLAVVVQWQSTGGSSQWIQLLVTPGLFTFLYLPLITCKFLYFQCGRSEKYFVHCSVELLVVNGIRFYHSYVVQFNMLLPTLFYPAVRLTFGLFQLVSTVFRFFQLLEFVSHCTQAINRHVNAKFLTFLSLG